MSPRDPIHRAASSLPLMPGMTTSVIKRWMRMACASAISRARAPRSAGNRRFQGGNSRSERDGSEPRREMGFAARDPCLVFPCPSTGGPPWWPRTADLSLLGPAQANPDGGPHEAGKVVHAETLHELGAVRLYRPVADPETLGDLLA